MHSLGYRDYLGAFQQYRLERPDDPGALLLAAYVIDYPYETLLFPGALHLLERLRTLGRVVLLTDGDAVFQPRKLQRSGLAAAVDGGGARRPQGGRAGIDRGALPPPATMC